MKKSRSKKSRETEKNEFKQGPLEEPHQRNRLTRYFLGCFVLGLLLLVALLLVGFALCRSCKDQVDLGVEYSRADFRSFIDEAGIQLEGKTGDFCLACPVGYSGQKEAELELTDAQVSAWLEEINSQAGLLEGTQVKIQPGRVSISTNLNYQGVRYPVFVAGEITKAGSRSVTVRLIRVKLGKLDLPPGFNPRLEGLIEQFVNHELGEIEGLEIDQLTLENGFIQFKGKIPLKAVAQ